VTPPAMDEQRRAEQLARLEELKRMGEKAYEEMYEANSKSGASGCYANAKDAFSDAMVLAKDLGLYDEWLQLVERLEHIKSVFRSQFS
jgi:hypothetical protein